MQNGLNNGRNDCVLGIKESYLLKASLSLSLNHKEKFAKYIKKIKQKYLIFK